MQNFHTEAIPDPEISPSSDPDEGLRHFILDIVETVVLSVLLFLAINAISARIRVESISMQPTLYEGYFLIVNKLAYKLGEPHRGDVIVFNYPPDPQSEPYIKRVIGLPGETVVVQNGVVSVNSEPLVEPYIKAPPSYAGQWAVPEGALFVLGDNRNSSSDSHSWGMVPMANVIGKAEVVYWPLQKMQVLNQPVAAAASPYP